MKILHIYDHTEPHQSGYVFRSRCLRTALERMGHECDVLSMPRHYADDNKVKYTDKTETLNNTIYYRTTPTTIKLPVLREVLDIIKTARYIQTLHGKNQYDYFHVHSPVLGVFAALLFRFLSWNKKVKIVYEIRAFWEDAAVDHGTLTEGSFKYKLIHNLETLACRMVDHIYPICNPLKFDLEERGIDKNKMTIIPNVVTENAFNNTASQQDTANLKRHYGITVSNYVLGFIGSFYAYEGLEDLMPIMLYYKHNNIPIKLLLVGGGTVEPVLREYVKNHNLETHIIFTGRIPHEQVNIHYQLCTAMIYPRRSMRLTQTVTPLKPLEAAAAKVPVILSNIGGHKELLTDKKTGFFIDNFTDIAVTAEKIKNILSDKQRLRIITGAAFDYVKNYRQPDKIVQRYYKLKINRP